jgi:hypothetical protein
MAVTSLLDGFRLVQTISGAEPGFIVGQLEGGTTGLNRQAPTALIPGLVMVGNDAGYVQAGIADSQNIVGICADTTDSTAAQGDDILMVCLTNDTVYRANTDSTPTQTDMFLQVDFTVSATEHQVKLASAADDVFTVVAIDIANELVDVIGGNCVLGGGVVAQDAAAT